MLVPVFLFQLLKKKHQDQLTKVANKFLPRIWAMNSSSSKKRFEFINKKAILLQPNYTISNQITNGRFKTIN